MQSGHALLDYSRQTLCSTYTTASYLRSQDPSCVCLSHIQEQMTLGLSSEVLWTRHAYNKPAYSRQTVRKVSEPHIAWGPLRAGCLLLGANFFSYLDAKLSLSYIDEFVVCF